MLILAYLLTFYVGSFPVSADIGHLMLAELVAENIALYSLAIVGTVRMFRRSPRSQGRGEPQ
jgi:hypothetical protein